MATVAALPIEPVAFGSPRRPAYLVETKSLGGTSGSPVFLHTEPNARTIGDPLLPCFLVGMMQGIHSGQYAADFIEGADKVVPKDADFNAGIGIVLPYTQIMEGLDDPALREARLKVLEAKRKQSGYRPASGGRIKQAPPTTDENPQHRDESLVNLNVAGQRAVVVGVRH